MAEGNATAASSAQTFPTGKSHLHVYSTLRPQQAPDGSLQLSTMNRNWFHALVILAIAVTGVPLFRRSLRLQLVLLLLIAAAVLLIGVFVPELARTLFEGVFPIALVILVIIWLIGHVSNLRWSRRDIASSPAVTPGHESVRQRSDGCDQRDRPLRRRSSWPNPRVPSHLPNRDTAANESDDDMPRDGGRRNA